MTALILGGLALVAIFAAFVWAWCYQWDRGRYWERHQRAAGAWRMSSGRRARRLYPTQEAAERGALIEVAYGADEARVTFDRDAYQKELDAMLARGDDEKRSRF